MHPAASTRAGPPPAPASARASAGRRRAAAARASASTSAPPSARRDPAAAPAPTATTTSTLPACVAALTRVDARGRRHEFYVVGTVHTPGSASAAEVRAVVETVRPDAVVLELDQERLDAIVATDLALALATSTSSTRGASYGADFLAGASAAESARALVVLGDAKARSLPDELRRRVFDASARELLDAPRLLRSLTHIPNALGLGLGPGPRGGGAGAVRFPDVVREDPGKLAPLRGPSLVALVALIATAYDAALSGGGGLGGGGDVTAATATTLAAASPPWRALLDVIDVAFDAAALLVFGRAVEVLLLDRDDVLAAACARAASACAGVDRGELRRVRHVFHADAATTAARERAAGPPGIPCFTLRRRMAPGEVRRLNLFEPRWLALMDRVARENGGNLVGAELGCVLGVNRRYVSQAWLDGVQGGESGGGERAGGESGAGESDATARSADLVVERWLRRAKVVSCEEGKRAVTGARKLEVYVKADDASTPPTARALNAHPAGYLVADVEGEIGDAAATATRAADESDAPPTRTVCVVGLAHCNGVVARLSTVSL